MKKLFLIIGIALLNINAFSQAPNWAWAKSAGGVSSDNGTSVATDGYGNVYVTGFFNSSTFLVGSITVTNLGNNDMFLIKYNSLGTVLWVNCAGGAFDDGGNSVTTDFIGNVYVTGYFKSPSIVFGSDTLYNADNSGTTADIYLVKYDSSGAVIWAKRAGGNTRDEGKSVAVDASNNVYLTGAFFSPTILFGTSTLTNSDNSGSTFDMFITKYDVSGAVVWAQSAFGASEGNSVTTDTSGNVFVTGIFGSCPTVFGSISLSCSVSADVFLAKYDSAGIVLWAKRGGGAQFDIANSVTTDYLGNSYITGFFKSPTILFGSISLANADNTGTTNDIFLVKYDASGTVLWAQSYGGGGFSDDDLGYSVTTDASNNIYLTGNFSSPNIIFGSTTLINANVSGGYDLYLVKYDYSGNVIWANRAGASYFEKGISIISDAFDNLYLTGSFTSPTLVFSSSTLNCAGVYDMMLVKIDSTQLTVGINEMTINKKGMSISPNPFTIQTNIAFSTEQNNTTIKITDMLGQEIKTTIFTGKQLVLDKGEMKAGIYFLQITDENKNVQNRKIVLQ